MERMLNYTCPSYIEDNLVIQIYTNDCHCCSVSSSPCISSCTLYIPLKMIISYYKPYQV